MNQGPQMNPYAPPTHPMQGGGGPPGSPEEAVRRGMCPQCGSTNVHQPSFTWWGGVLGPKLFDHWVCRSCGFGYNGSTGLSNRGKIIAYFVILNALVLAVVIAINVR
ncbi:MAG: hypothetical protein IPK82_32075 [Polyangiaceae bacterium]|nr:hypothetical protein [Polyangiaceae bacterium]